MEINPNWRIHYYITATPVIAMWKELMWRLYV